MTTRSPFYKLTLAVAAAALMAACSTKSSSPPAQNPTTPVPPPPVVTAFISISAAQNSIVVGSTTADTVTVRISASNGAVPCNGSTVTLSSNIGAFGSPTGPTTAEVVLTGGVGTAAFFGGTTIGTATIQANFTDTKSCFGGASLVAVLNVQIKDDTFFISAVTPSTGSPDGGFPVNILGNGFASPARVTFGSLPAVVTSVTPGRITVTAPTVPGGVPAGTTLPETVTVIIHVNQSNQKQDSLPSAFTYVNGGTGGGQPVVLSVSPATGPNEGGTIVTINGDGFNAPVQVFFENADGSVSVEAVVQSVTQTQIVVMTPAATGFGQPLRNSAVNVRVKNVNSGLQGVLTNGFRYGSSILITSIAPTQGLQSGGTRVTIFGQGFEAPVAVVAGQVAQQVVSVAGTEVDFQSVPVVIRQCQDQTGTTTVTNISNGDTANGPAFTYLVPRPIITSISPTSSGQNGGGTLTITGTGFSDPVRVEIGTQSTSSATVAPPQPPTAPPFTQTIKVTIPAFSGTFPTQACTVGGNTGTQNIPVAVDVKVTNVISTCTDTLAGVFQYLPGDTSCHVTLTPPVADFTATCSGFVCNFNDTSTGNPGSWAWNFDDPTTGVNNTSTVQNPTHTFSGNGIFDVSLTVANGGGSSNKKHFITCVAGVCSLTS